MPFSSTKASKFTYLHRRRPQNHHSHAHRHQKTLNFTKLDHTNNLPKHTYIKNHSFSLKQLKHLPFSSTKASKFTYLHRRRPQNHHSHAHSHQKTLNFTKSDYTNSLLKHIVHKNHLFLPNQTTQATFSTT